MFQQREWSEAEFVILLENPQLSDGVLAHKLPGRSAQEITDLRDMVHTYHAEARISEVRMRVAVPLLIRMGFALPRLKRGSWICPRCKEKH